MRDVQSAQKNLTVLRTTVFLGICSFRVGAYSTYDCSSREQHCTPCSLRVRRVGRGIMAGVLWTPESIGKLSVVGGLVSFKLYSPVLNFYVFSFDGYSIFLLLVLTG